MFLLAIFQGAQMRCSCHSGVTFVFGSLQMFSPAEFHKKLTVYNPSETERHKID